MLSLPPRGLLRLHSTHQVDYPSFSGAVLPYPTDPPAHHYPNMDTGKGMALATLGPCRLAHSPTSAAYLLPHQPSRQTARSRRGHYDTGTLIQRLRLRLQAPFGYPAQCRPAIHQKQWS